MLHLRSEYFATPHLKAFYKFNPSTMKTKQVLLRSFAIMGTMIFVFALSCKPGDQTEAMSAPVDPPKQIISIDQAATMFKEYSNRRVPQVVAALDSTEQENFIPARYTEFDYKVIKQYMAYIEQEAAAANTEIESLRIYYAVYPPGMGGKSKKSTVFLVPAAEIDGENRAFEVRTEGERTEAVAIPWDFGTGVEQMGMHTQKDQRQYATFGPAPFNSTTSAVQGDRSLVLNDGNTAPPPWH